MTKLKLGVISAIVIAAGAGLLVIQHQSQVKLREENESMRQQVEELVQLRAENERLSNLVSQANSAQALWKDQFSELLRLRGEVGVLRQQKRELARVAPEEKSLASAVPAPPSAPALPFQLHLVLDEEGDDAQSMTNNIKATDGTAMQETFYVQKIPLMDYTAINSANVVIDPSSGAPQIEILFTDQGREQFARITKEHINKRLAIAIDGQSYSAPIIRSEITEGKAMVSGSFTEEQARELASKINDAREKSVQ